MPVREIPKNHLVVTGRFASQKSEEMIAFESILEKELMFMLEFDWRVERFEQQPVRIPVSDTPKGYVPDLMVHYKAGPNGGPLHPNELIEVKASWDFEKHAEKYSAKFEAASKYAEDRGLVFLKKDERDIRTPRLANYKFLRRYRNQDINANHRDRLIALLNAEGGEASSCLLLDRLAPTAAEREALLPSFWGLILEGHIQADFDTQFTPNIAVWLPKAAL